MIAFVSETALLQKGHWKSENSTMVTRALAGPRTGSPVVEIFTASSSTGGGSVAIFFRSARIAASVLPAEISFATVFPSLRLMAQLGSFTRHSAIFISQPHEHCSERISLKANVFFAPV